MTVGDFKRYFVQHFLSYDMAERTSILSIIMEETLGMNQVEAILYHDQEIGQEKKMELQRVCQELSKNIPIQYIYQKAHFLGLSLYVDSRVLIPRQETEELVDWIVTTHMAAPQLRILDIGTGSGAIAIALKKHLPQASLTAIDISEGALAVAQQNAKRHGVAITFLQQDILGVEDLGTSYDIIVSNPPYVRELEKKEMHANVLDYEPSLALFVPDDNPLLFYEKIAEIAAQNLTEGGALYFEINQYLGKQTLEMLHKKGFKALPRKDLNDNDRMIRAGRAI
ncbi:MAG: peptide chain release factor N(5)-glutamine methyltransferase [Capnocytophaga gingivalis]